MSTTVKEVVGAQVALLFGKYRPAAGLSAEEIQGIRAERTEFTARLVALLRGIDAPEYAIIQEVRRVVREVHAEPATNRMATPDGIAARVRGSFAATKEHPCSACKTMGGFYDFAGADAPLRPPAMALAQYGAAGPWLCTAHYGTALWYDWRENRRRHGRDDAGFPPPFILPRVHSIRADWRAFTDGASMGPMARWGREFAGVKDPEPAPPEPPTDYEEV